MTNREADSPQGARIPAIPAGVRASMIWLCLPARAVD
jgi:hypothetical protein